MLVEGGNDLEPLWAVVDLVEATPQKVVFMTPAVPPVEDKRGDEVGNHAADCRRYVLRKIEHRCRGQPALPADPCEQDDAELDAVDQQHSQRPGAHLRQWPAGNDALKNEAEGECRDDGGQHGWLLRRVTCWIARYDPVALRCLANNLPPLFVNHNSTI